MSLRSPGSQTGSLTFLRWTVSVPSGISPCRCTFFQSSSARTPDADPWKRSTISRASRIFACMGWTLPRFDAGLQLVQLFKGYIAQKLVVSQHELVGNGHELPEYDVGRLVYAHVVAVALAHLIDAVGAFEKGYGKHCLGLLAIRFLDLPAHEEVEDLVVAPKLHIGLERDRIVSLNKGIEEFVDADGQSCSGSGS